jgi:hypothetical protein
MNQAEAATKKFRDGLGQSWQPWERETERQKRQAPKQAADVAGGFARSFSATLRTAFENLPKVELDADSSQAEIELQRLRMRLEDLADKRIGLDIDAGSALLELRTIQDELERVGDGATIDVRADVAGALAQLAVVDRSVSALSSGAGELGGKFSAAFNVIGSSGPAGVAATIAAINLLPGVASVAAGAIVLAVGGALATVGITAAAQSEEVKRAWSGLGAVLKAELSDVAEPLESSLIRAADVTEATFLRIKPALGRIFQDLVPDVDAFIDGVGAGVVRIMPHLEKLGGSFGTLLSGLGDRMPAIMDNLGETFSTFASIVDEDPQMLARLIEDATALVSTGAEVLSWADDIKAALTLPIDASGASNKLWEAMFGDASPEITMQNFENLPKTLQTMQFETGKAISAAHGLRSSSGTAAGGIRDLNSAMTEMFDPAQKALDAEIRLKRAIEEANQASKDKKMSELERLSTVREMTGAIADAAKIEHEQTGATKESTQAFLDALPSLTKYAGDNGTAKDAVAKLGESLGLTTKVTKDGVLAIDELGRVIKILPNGKKVAIDADTAKGKAELAAFMLYVARQKGTIDVHVRTIYDNKSGRDAIASKVKAAGGIQSADGRINYMAAGGMLPAIKNTPTLNPMSNTVWAEAGREAYIPYDGKYRSRAVDILGQVASDFGLEVVNKKAADSIGQVTMAVDATGLQVVDGLQSAVDAMSQTMGQAGTLTGAMDRVGVVGQSVADTWQSGSQLVAGTVTTVSGQLGKSMTGWGEVVSVSVADMSSNVGSATTGLGKEVVTLGTVISKAVDVVRAVANAKSKGTGGSEGAVLGPGAPSKSTGTGGSKGAIIGGPGPGGGGGSEGAVIGYVPPREAAPAPLDPHSSGVSGGT